jgi:hypothetical protein
MQRRARRMLLAPDVSGPHIGHRPITARTHQCHMSERMHEHGHVRGCRRRQCDPATTPRASGQYTAALILARWRLALGA